jgi:hypothetical protein
LLRSLPKCIRCRLVQPLLDRFMDLQDNGRDGQLIRFQDGVFGKPVHRGLPIFLFALPTLPPIHERCFGASRM